MGKKKVVTSRWKTVCVEFLRRGILIFIGPTEDLIACVEQQYPYYLDAVKEHVKSIKSEDTALGYTFKNLSDAIIYFPQEPDAGVLVHELCHSVMRLLDVVGVEVNGETEEIFCYLVEYFYNQTFDWLTQGRLPGYEQDKEKDKEEKEG